MFGFFQAVFVIVVVIIRKELKSRLLFKMGLKRRITFVFNHDEKPTFISCFRVKMLGRPEAVHAACRALCIPVQLVRSNKL